MIAYARLRPTSRWVPIAPREDETVESAAAYFKALGFQVATPLEGVICVHGGAHPAGGDCFASAPGWAHLECATAEWDE